MLGRMYSNVAARQANAAYGSWGMKYLAKRFSIDCLICGSRDVSVPDHGGRSGHEMTDRNGIDSFTRNGPRFL
jgi:hypothetical protein